MIVAGWDKDTGGQVYGCPIGGTLVQENWTTDGSGSTYIWGYLDATFRYSSQLAAKSTVVTTMTTFLLAGLRLPCM